MICIDYLNKEEAKSLSEKAEKLGEKYHAKYIRENNADVFWSKGFESFLDPVVERMLRKGNISTVEAICKVYYRLGLKDIEALSMNINDYAENELNYKKIHPDKRRCVSFELSKRKVSNQKIWWTG